MARTDLKPIIFSAMKGKRLETKNTLKAVLVEVQDCETDSQQFNKLSEYIYVLLDIQQHLGERMQPNGTIQMDNRKAK